MIFLLTLAANLAQTPAAPIALKHTFIKGQKSEYRVEASLDIEFRERGLTTFLPENQKFAYTFFTNTLDVNHDIADVRYSRPIMEETGSATPDADPKTVLQRIDYLTQLQVTPINQVVDEKDLSPKKKKPSGGDTTTMRAHVTSAAERRQSDMIGEFLGDLERLSVFIGGSDSSLDFEPKLSIDPVKIGDTWQRTVSYQPQKNSSKSGKDSMIVKRLDMTYTYKGLVESHGKQYQRILGEVNLKSDLGDFFNGFFQVKPEETGLKSIPTEMNLKMQFDLDPKTLQTINASIKSEANFQIYVTAFPDAYEEQKIHGSSEMHLVSNKMVAPAPPKK